MDPTKYSQAKIILFPTYFVFRGGANSNVNILSKYARDLKLFFDAEGGSIIYITILKKCS